MMLEAKQQSHQACNPLAALEVHWPCMLCTGPCGATGVPPNLHTHCLELYPVQGHAGLHLYVLPEEGWKLRAIGRLLAGPRGGAGVQPQVLHVS